MDLKRESLRIQKAVLLTLKKEKKKRLNKTTAQKLLPKVSIVASNA
jgi:hypothetical protein